MCRQLCRCQTACNRCFPVKHFRSSPEKPASSITDISAEGGNPGNPECFTLNITISEEKYFVDNHEITFEELKKDIDSLKEGSTVKIEDENSTLKAFNAVKNYLTEKEIPFNLD